MAYRPSPIVRSRKILALDFIRRFFIVHGSSPSHREIGSALDLDPARVSPLLAELRDEGSIDLTPGIRRSITLPRRAAMLANDELVLELQARGFIVELRPAIDPLATIAALVLIEGATEYELTAVARIDDITSSGRLSDGQGNGGEAGFEEDQAGDACRADREKAERGNCRPPLDCHCDRYA